MPKEAALLYTEARLLSLTPRRFPLRFFLDFMWHFLLRYLTVTHIGVNQKRMTVLILFVFEKLFSSEKAGNINVNYDLNQCAN